MNVLIADMRTENLTSYVLLLNIILVDHCGDFIKIREPNKFLF